MDGSENMGTDVDDGDVEGGEAESDIEVDDGEDDGEDDDKDGFCVIGVCNIRQDLSLPH